MHRHLFSCCLLAGLFLSLAVPAHAQYTWGPKHTDLLLDIAGWLLLVWVGIPVGLGLLTYAGLRLLYRAPAPGLLLPLALASLLWWMGLGWYLSWERESIPPAGASQIQVEVAHAELEQTTPFMQAGLLAATVGAAAAGYFISRRSRLA